MIDTQPAINAVVSNINSANFESAEKTLLELYEVAPHIENLHLLWALLHFNRSDIHKAMVALTLEHNWHPNITAAQQLLNEIRSVAPAIANDPLYARLGQTKWFRNRNGIISLLQQNSSMCEIGVLEGGFTGIVKKERQLKKSYLIDPWLYGDRDDSTEADQREQDRRYISVYKYYRPQIADGSVELIRAKSEDTWDLLEDNSIDFFYVDGDHTEKAATHDIALARAKTRSGGLISIDDYAPSWDGVFQAVNKLLRSSENWFTVEAITGNYGSSENIVLKKL